MWMYKSRIKLFLFKLGQVSYALQFQNLGTVAAVVSEASIKMLKIDSSVCKYLFSITALCMEHSCIRVYFAKTKQIQTMLVFIVCIRRVASPGVRIIRPPERQDMAKTPVQSDHKVWHELYDVFCSCMAHENNDSSR